MDYTVHRVTPLMVLPDIDPVVRQYRALGFELVDNDEPGCVGLKAGPTYLVLITAELMRSYFRPATVAPLIGTTVPYVYVSSLAEAKARLHPSATLVEETSAGGTVREAVVVQHGQFMVLAEKLD